MRTWPQFEVTEEDVIDALREQSYADFAPPKMLRSLKAKGYIVRRGDGYALTAKGRSHADFLFGRQARGRRAKSYNRRVSSCISGKVRGEGWSQRQAVAAVPLDGAGEAIARRRKLH